MYVFTAVVGIFLVVVLSTTVYAASKRLRPHPLVQTGVQVSRIEQESNVYSTVTPTLVSGSSSVVLLGTVLSHETANIYPRRDGIVEDVYVDIGDTVTKGQVVALLLSKGVEGQSAAAIAEKTGKKGAVRSRLCERPCSKRRDIDQYTSADFGETN